jgi:hypothetical protein
VKDNAVNPAREIQTRELIKIMDDGWLKIAKKLHSSNLSPCKSTLEHEVKEEMFRAFRALVYWNGVLSNTL